MSRCIRRFHPGIRRFIVPNNVFVAAWNAILYEWPVSALSPLDAHPETWNANFDAEDLASNPPGADTCILAVHNLGNTINVPALRKRFPSALVCEDACESMFGTYEGRPAGSAGFMSTMSFFSNKNISCGEGGAVLTNDDDAARLVRLMKGQGQGSTRYLHTELGFNYRMTNVQAALLLGQLELWDEIRSKKKALFRAYHERLGGHPMVSLQTTEAHTEHSQWMFGIRIRGLPDYQSAAVEFRRAGVETRPMFYPIGHHGHLQTLRRQHPVAEALHRECVILPSWPGMSQANVDQVCEAVDRVCELMCQHA
jgi:perosamine synthetase